MNLVTAAKAATIGAVCTLALVGCTAVLSTTAPHRTSSTTVYVEQPAAQGMAPMASNTEPTAEPTEVPSSTPAAVVAPTAASVSAPAGVMATVMTTACEEEDSVNCYWDATVSGNGQGQSFYSIQVGQRVCTLYWDESFARSHDTCE